MRTSDKKKNMQKANLLAESLYKQRINEDFDYAAAEREYHDKEDYENMSVEEFIGSPVSVNRKFENVHTSEPDLPIQGVFAGIDRSEGLPMMVIEKNGKKVGYILYDKKKDRFVEGMSSWSYVYEPMDAETADLLKRFAKLSLQSYH